jgi:two-component system chemotaxis response regulator CheY
VPFKVLLIDDSRTMREVLKVYLMGGKYEFVEADGAQRGLDLLRLLQIDLVISDVKMPRVDGIAFVQMVRASDRPHVATVPIILVTSDRSKEMQARLAEADADAFLIKPLDADRLCRVVAELIARATP